MVMVIYSLQYRERAVPTPKMCPLQKSVIYVLRPYIQATGVTGVQRAHTICGPVALSKCSLTHAKAPCPISPPPRHKKKAVNWARIPNSHCPYRKAAWQSPQGCLCGQPKDAKSSRFRWATRLYCAGSSKLFKLARVCFGRDVVFPLQPGYLKRT